MKKNLFTVAVLTAVLLSACSTPDYRDASLSPEVRTQALLKQMTLDEKIGQIICPLGWPMYEKVS